MSALDRRALGQGASVALLFAVPFSIGASLLNAHDDKSPWVGVLWLGALAGFTLGAAIAAWAQTTGYPMVHGMFAAGGTYLAAQGVFTIIRLARGASVSWLGLFFTFTTVMLAGVIGGAIGSALRKRGIVPGALAAAKAANAAEQRGEQ